MDTGVEVLIKVRAVDKVEGSLGKAYWIGSELAAEVGRYICTVLYTTLPVILKIALKKTLIM